MILGEFVCCDQPILVNVVVRDAPGFGRTAFATRRIEAGEVVIAEKAMLPLRVGNETDIFFGLNNSKDFFDANDEARSVEDVRMTALREAFWELAKAAKVSLEQLAPLYAILANESITGQLLDEVLVDMYAPRTENPSAADTRMLELFFSNVHFDKCVPNWSPAKRWFREAGIRSCFRLLSCCRINVHADDTRGFSGLFQKCSKFAHSCNANTFWFLHVLKDEEGGGTLMKGQLSSSMAVHVAVRRVEEGEMLSFSYLGTGLNMLSPTSFRRAKLRDLSFDCLCDRCALFDCGRETSRSLRCPDCDKPAALSLVPPSGGWFCMACRDSKGYDHGLSASLFRETVLRTAAMQLYFSSSRGGGADSPTADDVRRAQRSWIAPELAAAQFNGVLVRWSLAEQIERYLGPTHFLFMTAVFAIFRCWIRGIEMLVEAEKTDIEVFLKHKRALSPQSEPWERQLLRWYVAGKRWLVSNCPGSCLTVTFALLVTEAVAHALGKVEVVSLLEAHEIGYLKQLEAAVADDAAKFQSFTKWKEFYPMYPVPIKASE